MRQSLSAVHAVRHKCVVGSHRYVPHDVVVPEHMPLVHVDTVCCDGVVFPLSVHASGTHVVCWQHWPVATQLPLAQ